jgi:DNA-binding NarL/FixJ family response regulator
VFDRLSHTASTIRTIAVSLSTGAAISLRVFQTGAVGLVSKRQPPAMLLSAVRRVYAGEAWLGRTTFGHVFDLARATRRNRKHAKSGSAALSARDRQLIALVGEGWRNADIARYLVASEATVRASLTSIFRKLGVPNRFALMIYASQHGYVTTGSRPRQQDLFR